MLEGFDVAVAEIEIKSVKINGEVKQESDDKEVNNLRSWWIVASRMAVINGKDPTSCASPRINKHGWHKKHEEFTCIARNSRAEVCLMGDSIVDGLARYPKV